MKSAPAEAPVMMATFCSDKGTDMVVGATAKVKARWDEARKVLSTLRAVLEVHLQVLLAE